MSLEVSTVPARLEGGDLAHDACIWQRWQQREAAEQLACPWLWGKIWHLTGELASADEKTEETGEAVATLHCGGNTPFNEGSSEVMFSGGRMQEEVCSLPAANGTCRAPEGVSLSALGPGSQSHKMLFGVCQQGNSVCSCSRRCWLPGSPWQPRCMPGYQLCLGEMASISVHVA